MLSRLCSGYIPIHPYQIETKDVITSKETVMHFEVLLVKKGKGKVAPKQACMALRGPGG
jgi:hypothetical protein